MKSLTKRRKGELKEARSKHGFANVWSSDGKILYKDMSDHRVKVFYD